jgi:hypothetical protein
VIADCKDELAGGDRNDEALIDAVFGSVVTQTRVLENGEKKKKMSGLTTAIGGMRTPPGIRT